MAEVGVLQLTIEDNSESAARGLSHLATALERVQQAVGNGLNGLQGVSSNIEKIARIVNEAISGATIEKLGKFAESLNGLKGINLKSVANAMRSFDQGDAIEKTKNQVNALSTEYSKAWTAMNTFYTKYAEIQRLMTGTGMALLGSGGVAPEKALSTQVWTGPNWSPDWTHGENFHPGWTSDIDKVREDAIEVEGTVTAAMENMEQSVSGAAETISGGMTTISGAMEDAAGATGTASEGMMEVRSATEDAAGSSHRFADALDAIRSKSRGIWSSLMEARDAVGGLRGAFTAMFPTLSAFLSGIIRIAKYRFIRAVIKQITAGISEGVKNVYWYSKAIGGTFATDMDSAASALLQMKNTIGAALAPMIQSLIPYLQIVVNWFINLVNYVNQFLSLLRGQQTWTRAVPKTTQAFEDQTKAAKKAGAAIKDLLADWDELNIIQSESTGGAGGGAAKAAEDYLSMFEQVDKFDDKIKSLVDFLKEHMDQVKKLIAEAGLALLAWKFSNAFTGILSQLATIAAVGLIVAFTVEATTLLDEAYVETDNAGYLIGDMVLTGALAGVAKKLADAKFGAGIGSIAASIVFGVSAGASLFVATEEAQNESQKKMLLLLSAVKIGISAALAAAGFVKLGFGLLSSIGMGLILATLTAFITYQVKITAEEAQRAEEMAKAAFAQTGAGGGIKPQDYIDALQAEFTKQTGTANLIISAYVSVPDLKSQLTTAALQISGFNWIIFHGPGKLTESDAEEFKKNWAIILDTLDKLNTDTYNTILSGVTDALASKSEEIRKSAEEIRTSFIMMEKEISKENAELYRQMEDITEKIASGSFSDEDLAEYEKLYTIYAAATNTGLAKIQAAINNGDKIDFGDESTALENAREFIKTVGANAADAIKEVDDSVNAVEEAVALRKNVEFAKMEAGIIDKTEYDRRAKMYDDILTVVKENATLKKDEIDKKMQEAYDTVFKQALTGPYLGNGSYWETILIPLMKDAKEAGYTMPEELIEAYREGLEANISRVDFYSSPFDIVKKIMDAGEHDPKKVANAIKEYVVSMFGQQSPEWWNEFQNFYPYLPSTTNIGLTPVEVQAGQIMEVSGWDLLAKQGREEYAKALQQYFGDAFAIDVLTELKYSNDEIYEYLGIKEGMSNSLISGITEGINSLNNLSQIKFNNEEEEVNIWDLINGLDENNTITVRIDPLVEGEVDLHDLIPDIDDNNTINVPVIPEEEEVDIHDLIPDLDDNNAINVNVIPENEVMYIQDIVHGLDDENTANVYIVPQAEGIDIHDLIPGLDDNNTINVHIIPEEEEVDIWDLIPGLEEDNEIKVHIVPEEEDVDIWDLTGKNGTMAGLFNPRNFVASGAYSDISTGRASDQVRKSIEDATRITEPIRNDVEMETNVDEAITFDTEEMQESAGSAAWIIEDMAGRILAAFQSIDGIGFTFDTEGESAAGKALASVPGAIAKAGGSLFRSGDVFGADENGRAALVGSFGNKAGAMSTEQMENAVETGARNANATQDELIRQLVNITRQIANKEFVVQVTPDSAWGDHNAKSSRARARVTGDLVTEY